jgi:hypothetical protein
MDGRLCPLHAARVRPVAFRIGSSPKNTLPGYSRRVFDKARPNGADVVVVHPEVEREEGADRDGEEWEGQVGRNHVN